MPQKQLTQKERIKAILRSKKKLTAWEAITKYRITRLSALIYKLRYEGWEIETQLLANASNDGTYAKYILIREPKNKKLMQTTQTQTELYFAAIESVKIINKQIRMMKAAVADAANGMEMEQRYEMIEMLTKSRSEIKDFVSDFRKTFINNPIRRSNTNGVCRQLQTQG